MKQHKYKVFDSEDDYKKWLEEYKKFVTEYIPMPQGGAFVVYVDE